MFPFCTLGGVNGCEESSGAAALRLAASSANLQRCAHLPRLHPTPPSKHTLPPNPTAFPREPRLDTLLPRLIYCACHFGQLVFVLNKLNSMGLLPTHASDWMASLPVPPPATIAVQAI